MNIQVSVSAMEILGVLVEKLGTKFKPHLSTSESLSLSLSLYAPHVL